jgi:hypothetical protein
LRSGRAGRTRRADLATRSCQYGRLLSLPAVAAVEVTPVERAS